MAKPQKLEVIESHGPAQENEDPLERVKEILVGAQIKNILRAQQDFALSIDEKMRQVSQRLSEKCDTIEEFVKKTSQSLSSQLQHESSTRAKEDEGIKELLLDSLMRYSKELHFDIDKQGESLKKELSSLNDAKVDRTALAKVLTDNATKILDQTEHES